MLGNLNPFNKPIITKTVNKLLAYGIQGQSSDIKLEIVQDGSLEAKYKTFGQFTDSLYFDSGLAGEVFEKIKHLAGLNSKNLAGSFNFSWPDGQLQVAAGLIKTGRGEVINLKIKPNNQALLFLDELGLDQNQFELIKKNLYTKGLIVISGPEHSGKTTTAFACLLACNSINFNVYSLGTSDLLKLRGLNQVLVKNNRASSWQESLAAIAKQDADIIYLDEPPTDFDARLLAPLSTTKTVIISTSATTSQEAVKRLTNSGLFTDAAQPKFNLLINQRLVRRLCSDCSFVYHLDEKIYQELASNFEILDQDLVGLELFHAQGCPLCQHTGYLNQLGLFEVIKTDEALNLSLTKSLAKTELGSVAELSLVEDGFIKALKGLTTVEELKRVI